jgi:hypothetical protein
MFFRRSKPVSRRGPTDGRSKILVTAAAIVPMRDLYSAAESRRGVRRWRLKQVKTKTPSMPAGRGSPALRGTVSEAQHEILLKEKRG